MKELKFVDVGEGITEGHFQKWLVKDGESVKEDQALAQIETDKAVVNLPAPISGTVKLVAKEDSTVKVGDTLAFVGTADELSSAERPPPPKMTSSMPTFMQQQPPKPEPVSMQAQPIPQQHEIMATPYVRKLARDNNIDITKVAGTGPGGRILENDIR
ncbi:MAG: E3 binding domain-containing protein, partial [Candidatus Micrarchaeota archaeon]|nr:E3 binding domain-containing protein [Candidatus Micrarchaeota archaeon]